MINQTPENNVPPPSFGKDFSWTYISSWQHQIWVALLVGAVISHLLINH